MRDLDEAARLEECGKMSEDGYLVEASLTAVLRNMTCSLQVFCCKKRY